MNVDWTTLETGGTFTKEGTPVNPKRGSAVGVQNYPTLADAFANARPGEHVGYWRDQDGTLHVDVVQLVTSKRKAIRLGRKAEQIAIYDFKRSQEIRL
jgi:hypothetical protein